MSCQLTQKYLDRQSCGLPGTRLSWPAVGRLWLYSSVDAQPRSWGRCWLLSGPTPAWREELEIEESLNIYNLLNNHFSSKGTTLLESKRILIFRRKSLESVNSTFQYFLMAFSNTIGIFQLLLLLLNAHFHKIVHFHNLFYVLFPLLPRTLSTALALKASCWFWWSGETWHSNSLNLPNCTSSTYRWYSPVVTTNWGREYK